MKLIVFAHRGEAQAFLNHFSNTQPDEFLYRSENYFFLIGGEGGFKMRKRMEKTLQQYAAEIEGILNAGVAGSLHDDLPTGAVFEIKRVVDEVSGRMLDLQSAGKGLTCVSAQKQADSDDYALRLSKLGDVVDRELYEVTSVAMRWKLPVRSIKIISDRAGNSVDKHAVISKASWFSRRLFDYFIEKSEK